MGYLLSEIGLGQAARNIAYAMESENLPVDYVNINLEGRSNDQEFIHKRVKYKPDNINFFVCDLLAADKCLKSIEKFGLGKKNYFYPSWELDRLPYSEVSKLLAYDDVIAPSTFIAKTLSVYLDRPIKTILQPVVIPDVVTENKIKNGVLRIYSAFDFDSFSARKNPKGIVEAFKAAFPDRIKDVELILKVRGVNDGGSREMLKSYCSQDQRITVIDKTLSRSEVDIIANNCNVFLSMHRSEGVGLGPAEALASEKIVVATDYGGTTDFVNSSTGFPVSYKMVAIKPGEYLHWDKQLWADPSIESAADSLKSIYHNFEGAQARAKEGRNLMIKQHSVRAVGVQLKELL